MSMSQQKKQMLHNFFTALADVDRLTIIGLLNDRAYSVTDLAGMLGRNESTIAGHVTALREVGLLNLRNGSDQPRYQLNANSLERWQHMVMDLRSINHEPDQVQPDKSWIADLPLDEYEKRVIKGYTIDRRLKHIPVQQKKLNAVLRWIILDFEPDVMYTEHEVNTIISRYHEDYARLRRELIDIDFLRRERDGRAYWLTPEDE